MKPLKRRKVVKKLKAEGFTEVKHNGKTRGKGSHTLFRHEDGRTTLVHNDSEISGGEIKDISKQSGINFYD